MSANHITVEELRATFDEKYFVSSILLFRPSNTVIRTSVYMYVYIADSIKDALGIGKLLFGGHSSKSLHCSICQNAQCAIINDQLPKYPFLI